MFKMEINTGGAAFHTDEFDMDHFAVTYEVRQIMNRAYSMMAMGYTSGACMDTNGNVVGEWEMTA